MSKIASKDQSQSSKENKHKQTESPVTPQPSFCSSNKFNNKKSVDKEAQDVSVSPITSNKSITKQNVKSPKPPPIVKINNKTQY